MFSLKVTEREKKYKSLKVAQDVHKLVNQYESIVFLEICFECGSTLGYTIKLMLRMRMWLELYRTNRK